MKKMTRSCVAISFDTKIFNDLKQYLKSDEIELKINDPTEFLNTTQFSSDDTFINLVIKDFNLREQISEHMTRLKCDRFSFVHRTACVDGAIINDGCFVYPNVTVYPNATVEQDVIIQANSRISHNVRIQRGVFIGGLVNISGSSTIGKFVKLYPSCNITDKISVADYVTIGTGTTLRKNITESGTYSKLSDKIKKIN